MDVVNAIINAENLRTLFLFVAWVAGVVWLDRQFDRKIGASENRFDKKLNGLGVELRGEIGALRLDMDARFAEFHKTLKENDFAHLNETIKALTFTLQKNKILEPEDKKFIDSHLEGSR